MILFVMQTVVSSIRTAPIRFAAKYVVSDTLFHNGTACWIWTAVKTKDGYGRFRCNGKIVAHRFSYELHHGPVPEGLELDHLCRNHSCVNPAHLEPVTHKVNMQRGIGYWIRKTHCPEGHPYSGGNLYVTKDGYRKCRTCIKRWNKEQRVKRALRSAQLLSLGTAL